MIKRMQPVKLTSDQAKKLNSKFSGQDLSTSAPKSADPVNFPVHEIIPGAKELIYVPNHTTEDAEGNQILRWDTPNLHMLIDGRRFPKFRCVRGIVDEELGFDGSCPICDAIDECWDLANFQIAEKCKQAHLNAEDRENEKVKKIRSECFNNMVMKSSNPYYTFPIVVIETENNDGKTLAKDENGDLILKPMWYTISKAQYEKKWLPALEVLDDEPSHPGGYFFLLNYNYKTKSGEMNKRDAAQNVSINAKNIKESIAKAIRERADKLTEGWTPDVAMQMVIDNQVFTLKQLTEAVDSVMETTRQRLVLYQEQDDNDTLGIESKEDGGDPFGNLTDKVGEDSESEEEEGFPIEDTDEDDFGNVGGEE